MENEDKKLLQQLIEKTNSGKLLWKYFGPSEETAMLVAFEGLGLDSPNYAFAEKMTSLFIPFSNPLFGRVLLVGPSPNDREVKDPFFGTRMVNRLHTCARKQIAKNRK